MEIGEVIACLICIFVLCFATVVCFNMAVKFQDNMRFVKIFVIGGWLLIADETGQSIVALSGAIKGNAHAQVVLGLHYMNGSMPGTYRGWRLWWPKNPQRGQFWLDKAATSGSPLALAALAEAYLDGNMGLPHDPQKAAAYLRSILGNGKADSDMKAEAAFNLYRLYKEGDGVPQDYGEAFRYCLIASDEGSAAAAYEVGQAYEMGEMVPVDFRKAYLEYQKAADGGYFPAIADVERIKKEIQGQ